MNGALNSLQINILFYDEVVSIKQAFDQYKRSDSVSSCFAVFRKFFQRLAANVLSFEEVCENTFACKCLVPKN